MPPSITSSDPVMWLDASEHRNSTPLAMSSAWPALPIGTVASAILFGSSGALRARRQLGPDRRVDDAGMHRVHPDVVARRRALQRDRLGEQPHRALGRAVAGQVRRTAQPGDRRHHHDRTAAGTAHQRDAVFHRQEHAVDVHRHLPPPVGQRHVDRRSHDADAGIGHQDMQPAEPFRGRDHRRASRPRRSRRGAGRRRRSRSARRWPAASSRSVSTSFAPSRDRTRAQAAPMPDAAPVMMPILPSS